MTDRSTGTSAVHEPKPLFVIGSSVFLQSGGYPMTVVALGDTSATCVWHDDVGCPQVAAYPFRALSPDMTEKVQYDVQEANVVPFGRRTGRGPIRESEAVEGSGSPSDDA